MPPGNNLIVGEENNGHVRRYVVVLACHDDSKGLLSILVLKKKHERKGKFFVVSVGFGGEAKLRGMID